MALVDAPIDHAGRVLLIERHVASLAELEGIVAAYVEHSTHAEMPGLLASRQLLDELADHLDTDDYVVDEQLPDGRLVIRPDTSAAAMRRRLGSQPLTTEEFAEHFGDLPTDDEC